MGYEPVRRNEPQATLGPELKIPVLSRPRLLNFLIHSQQMCQCSLCVERISKPPVQHTDAQFIKDLIEGRVAHIATKPNGQPVYIWTGP